MSFLAPWMLYGLGALAAPVIIHLWQRRRVVQMPFSTLRFLKIVAARTSRSSRIENLLLLLLRCTIFALLVFAFARPVIKAGAAKFPGGDVPRTVVLILDNSLSMSYRAGDHTRLETAQTEALAVIDDLKPGDKIAVLAASDHAELLVAEPTVDHAVARKSVEKAPQTEARTDFAPALREASKIAAHAERGVRQIYLFTDNQESGWQFDPALVFDEVWKKSEASLVVVRPDDLGSGNAAVTQMKMPAPFLTPGAMMRGVATVENFSAAPLHDVLDLMLNDGRVAQCPIDVAPGSSADVPFAFSAPAIAGRWARGCAKLSGDNLAGDDQFFFAVPVYQPPRVLVVEGQQIGPERQHSGFYLRKALAAGGDNSVSSVKTISTSALDDTPLENFSTVFLTDSGQLSDRAAVRLDRFLESGGTIAMFPGEQSTSFSRFDFSPITSAALHELPAGRLAAKIVEPAHPLFANAWDADTPFPALPQRKILDVNPAPDAKTLVTVAGKLPFVIAANRGPGRVIFVNASADRAWGDFPLSPAFLPLVQQIARLSVSPTGRLLNFVVGDPLPVPPNLPRQESLTLTLPDHSTRDLPAGEKSRLLDHAEQPGFYEARAGSETMLFAVNTDRRESNLKPIDPAALAKITPHEIVTGLDDLKVWLAQTRGLVPIWPPLLVLALLVYAAESVIANVMARKRSQGDEKHIATGRLNKRRMGAPFRPAETEVNA